MVRVRRLLPALIPAALAVLVILPLVGQEEKPQGKKDALARSFTNSIGMKLVLIPKGKFKMGSPEGEKDRSNDEKQHEVEITKPFYLGVYTVTQKQYKEVMGDNPSWFSADGAARTR
jgi:formylglycine-generating enzyme required for sulfatase activity